MSFKNLLVHVDETEACAGRLDAAIALAEAQNAHLTGLALAVEVSLPSYVSAQMPSEVLEIQHARALESSRAAAARFAKAMESGGRAVDCRMARSQDIDVARVIALHARYADLVILGQPDTESSGAVAQQAVEDVILSSGRPTLVVPRSGPAKSLGEWVLVAWDASREAARAVNDALPILRRAKAVTVLSINAQPSTLGHGEEPGADLGAHLARHGVAVEVQHCKGEELGVGEAILSRVADHGADLLVMGAYGHSRIREVVLGGATRHLLQHMTVPTFMSH